MWCVPGGNSIYSALGMAVWGERPDVIAPIGPEYPVAKLCDRINLGQCRPIERNLRNWGLYEEDGTRHFIFRVENAELAGFQSQASRPGRWALRRSAISLRSPGASSSNSPSALARA